MEMGERLHTGRTFHSWPGKRPVTALYCALQFSVVSVGVYAGGGQK